MRRRVGAALWPRTCDSCVRECRGMRAHACENMCMCTHAHTYSLYTCMITCTHDWMHKCLNSCLHTCVCARVSASVIVHVYAPAMAGHRTCSRCRLVCVGRGWTPRGDVFDAVHHSVADARERFHAPFNLSSHHHLNAIASFHVCARLCVCVYAHAPAAQQRPLQAPPRTPQRHPHTAAP